MSRLLAATVSIAHGQNCMPIAPDAAGGAGCGTKVLRHHLTNIRRSAYPDLPETELLEFCKERDVVFLAFAPLGHGMRPGPLEDPVISAIAARVGKTPAQVLLAWAGQRGTALPTTLGTAARARENLDISALPEDALDEINRIQTRQKFNEVVKTGSPGFIPQGR
jgi:diketogulonate reductase-like aldo/keto reductase